MQDGASLSWKQIVSFNAAAQLGGFSKAATFLGVTPPAVTAQISGIERQFRVKLFLRTSAGVELTPIGRSLFATTKSAGDIKPAAEEVLNGPTQLAGQVLRIIAAAPRPAMILLGAFNRLYPEVAIDMTLGRWIDVVSGVEKAEIDIGFIVDPPRKKRLYAKRIIEQRIVAVIPASFPIARKNSVSIRELVKYPLLQWTPGSLMFTMFERRFRELGVSVQPVLRLADRDALYEAVAVGIGIAFMYELASSRRENVIVRPVTDFEPVTEYVFCLDRARKRKIIAKFLEIAGDVIDRGGAYG